MLLQKISFLTLDFYHISALKEKMFVRGEKRQIVGQRVGVMAIVETGGGITPETRILEEVRLPFDSM